MEVEDQVSVMKRMKAQAAVSLLESGRQLYSGGMQMESFLALWASALVSHRLMHYESAAESLSIIVNLIGWPIDDLESVKIISTHIKKHQVEMLDYPQYFNIACRLAGKLGDVDWAQDLAGASVRRVAFNSGRVQAPEMVEAGAFPSLIIAGFMKCGTTSLYDYLVSQSWALPSAAKEVGWLGAEWGEKLGWPFYKACFPARVAGRPYAPVCIDADPLYISNDASLEAIQSLPHAIPVVVVVRDPFERFLSHFEHDFRTGNVRGEGQLEVFARHLVVQIENGVIDNALRSNSDMGSPLFESIYTSKIKALIERIGSNRVSVLDISDFSDFEFMRAWVKRWLGRDIDEGVAIPISNAKVGSQNTQQEMTDATRRIRSFLLDANRELPVLAGRSFPWIAG